MDGDSRYRTLFHLLPSVCLTLDGEGLVRQANPAALAVLGFDPAELVNHPVINLVHLEEVALVSELLAQPREPVIVRQADVRMRTRVGGHRWFRWSVTRFVSGELVIVAEDLSPRLVAGASIGTDPFRVLVDTLPDYSIFLLDETGYVTSWNDGAKRITGFDAADVLGRHFAMFFPTDAQEAGVPQGELEESTRAGYIETEGWRVRKDGSRFWALSVLTALRDPTGRLIGFGKITRDLTERRLAEETLRVSEERLRLLVDAASEYAIFMLDPVGRVQTWNAGAERIKGYLPQEIIGEHFSRFYTPEDISDRKPTRALATARDTGKFQDEGWRLRKDGTRFWASVTISRLVNSSNDLIGFGKVTRDLTARRQTEEALRQSEERFRLLVDTVQDYAIFLLDPEGRVQSWNRGAQRLKGYTSEEIIGSHFSRFYEADDIAALNRRESSRPRSRRVESRTKVGASARTARASGATS